MVVQEAASSGRGGFSPTLAGIRGSKRPRGTEAIRSHRSQKRAGYRLKPGEHAPGVKPKWPHGPREDHQATAACRTSGRIEDPF